MTAVVALLGCDAEIMTRTENVAVIEIAAPETLGFQETATATAVTLDADGEPVSGVAIDWESSD